jgi:glycosyltransferase involved in cell wall biosynthesis
MNDQTQLERFHPARYSATALPRDRFNVLHAGPLTSQSDTRLLTDAFLAAHDRTSWLHLNLAGDSSEQPRLRRMLGAAATFHGDLDEEALAQLYASADLLLCTATDHNAAGAILAAQASGLPVLAVGEGPARELIQDGRSGCLAPPDATAIATAVQLLARRDAVRDRLATGGLVSARAHAAAFAEGARAA